MGDGRAPNLEVLAGKAEPTTDNLSQLQDAGYDHFEVRTCPRYLVEPYFSRSLDALNEHADQGLEAVTVHAPHVMPGTRPHPGNDDFPDEEELSESPDDLDWLDYFRRVDRMADELDAYLVIHSMGVHEDMIPRVEQEISFQSDYGYEHHNGEGLGAILNGILDPGHELVYDNAHHFTATRDPGDAPEDHRGYREQQRELFGNYADRISCVHLNDARRRNHEDGLAFGEGEIDLEQDYRTIRSQYDGPIVLEVMPEHQEEAREMVESWDVETARASQTV